MFRESGWGREGEKSSGKLLTPHFLPLTRGYDGIGVWRAKGRGRWCQGEGDSGVSFRGWVVLCSGRVGGEESIKKAPENCLHLIFFP